MCCCLSTVQWYFLQHSLTVTARKQSIIHIYQFISFMDMRKKRVSLCGKPYLKMHSWLTLPTLHFSPHPDTSRHTGSLFAGSVEKGAELQRSSLLKYLGDGKIPPTRSVYCLRGFTAAAGGFLEGDFEQHLKTSWQIISAKSQQAGCFSPAIFCVRPDFL